MWYTVTIESGEPWKIDYQTIRLYLTDAEYNVIKKLCDKSDGSIYIDIG